MGRLVEMIITHDKRTYHGVIALYVVFCLSKRTLTRNLPYL